MKLQTIKTQTQKGFTLIELMITVAIVGILSAVALPAYSDYTNRAKVAEGISLTQGAKTAVTESFQSNSALPADNAAAGFSSPTGKYVSGVAISAGIITATFGAGAGTALSGATVTLTPDTTSGNITWTCGGTVDAAYMPSSCR